LSRYHSLIPGTINTYGVTHDKMILPDAMDVQDGPAGAFERICGALHICSYVLFRNMWSIAELEPKKSLSSAPSTAHI